MVFLRLKYRIINKTDMGVIMNTLDIAKSITPEDIEKAKRLHFMYKADCLLDGMKEDVDKICSEKGLTHGVLDTVFALTYARLNEVK